MPLTYLFEVRQIQNFIFSTNKLRDATGASELINTIASDDSGGKTADPESIVGKLLNGLGLTQAVVQRATGGVVELTCEDGDLDKLHKFRAALRLQIGCYLPGLTYSDGIGKSAQDARRAAAGGMVQSEIWPMIAPIMRPAPLSGGAPAVVDKLTSKRGKCHKTGAFADFPTLIKRDNEDRKALARKFLPPEVADSYYWPVEFPDNMDVDSNDLHIFPFAGKGLRRVALLHADGNGMGALFQNASAFLNADRSTRDLSRAIAKATREAVQEAMKATVVPAASAKNVLPCRPILLGGDDVTLILRADLALPFARFFLDVFESKTRDHLKEFGRSEGLTAKMGIVFLAPNQPFGAAHRLCESLTASAKDVHSKVAFWRLTSSAIPQDVEELESMTSGPNGIALRRKAHDLAGLAKIEALAALLSHDDVGGGAIRRVPELLRTDEPAALRVFERALLTIRKKSGGDETLGAYQALCKLFEDMGLSTTSSTEEIRYAPLDANRYSPLWEAHELRQISQLSTQSAQEGEAA